MNPEEVIKVVAELNDKIDYVEDVSEMIYWCAQTDGNYTNVKYLGCVLWSSENDDREFFDDKDDWEPLETFLIRAQNTLIDNIIKHRIAPEESEEA